jgi:DNA polymerase elongation subunit (family B)
MKSAVMDIETTDLAAVGSGILLCVGIKPLNGGKSVTFRLDDYDGDTENDEYGFFEKQEMNMLWNVVGELDKYDLLVGHYIDKFDVPFLRSRAYQYGCTWNSHPLTYDTKSAFRRTGFLTRQNGFGKTSASMDMVADFLGLEQLKTKIYPREWWQSIWGNKEERTKAMNNIVNHNKRDIEMNSKLYPLLLANDPRVIIKRLQ